MQELSQRVIELSHGFSFKLVQGRVGQLGLHIPWGRLGQEGASMVAEDVDLVWELARGDTAVPSDNLNRSFLV
jgi:hypothetical protein